MNNLLFILFVTCFCNIASAQSDYRQISEAAIDSIINRNTKTNIKDYKQVDLDSYVLQGERVMFTAKWTGNLSKYRCALPLYDSQSAVVYSCRNKKDNKKSWDEENHVDFSGITIIINGLECYIPISYSFSQYDELNQHSGTSHNVIIMGLVVKNANKKAVNPTLIIENVKILK